MRWRETVKENGRRVRSWVGKSKAARERAALLVHYFCSTVDAVDEKTVMEYIENQKWDFLTPPSAVNGWLPFSDRTVSPG